MTLKPTQDFLRLSDRQELFYRVYGPSRPKGVLIILHGLGEHSGRYDDFAKFISGTGWKVYLYDQRGHGKTPGLRSYVESFHVLVDDLHQFVEFVTTQESRRKPFLMGHSFGGQVVINYLTQYPAEVRGVILSSPNIRLAMAVPWIKKFLGRWVSCLLPSFSVPNDINPRWISHDKKIVQAYQDDPLVQNRITLRLGNELLSNLEKVPGLAPKIKTPILLFQGSADKVTCPDGTKEFYQKIPGKDKELKIYPGFFHETLNEQGRKQVYHDVAKWLEKRVG
jgi:alpha-beta hydrolase superfamily lysophospholipase